MTLPKNIFISMKRYSGKKIVFRKPLQELCIICKNYFDKKIFRKHLISCYNKSINKLLLDFDAEMSKTITNYENKISMIKNDMHLSDLCNKCIYYSNEHASMDIEDIEKNSKKPSLINIDSYNQ